MDGCGWTNMLHHCRKQLQNPGTEKQPPHFSSFHPLLLIPWSMGTLTGSHRKFKCCLMRIVRYLNQKWMAWQEKQSQCTSSTKLPRYSLDSFAAHICTRVYLTENTATEGENPFRVNCPFRCAFPPFSSSTHTCPMKRHGSLCKSDSWGQKQKHLNNLRK